MIVSISMDVMAPQIIRKIIDDVVVGRKIELLTNLLLTLLLLGCARAIFQYVKEFVFDFASARVACGIRKNLFHHIEGLSLRYFNQNNSGELMARVKDDVDKLWNLSSYVGMLVLEITIHCSLVLICMFYISPILTLIPLLIMPIVAVTAIRMEKDLDVVFGDISEENANLNRVAGENIGGARTVKAFARENYEINRFREHNKKFNKLNMDLCKSLVKRYPNIQFFTKVLLVIVVVVGGFLVMEKQITLGQLGAFTEYSYNIIWPMELIGWLVKDIAAAIASEKKIKNILQEKSEVCDPEEPVKMKDMSEIEGKLEFKNVSFTLENQEIVNDINFTLEKGKVLGIMGATGSGKSSIVNLIQRFYDVGEGEILLDGVNIKDYALSDLRKTTSVVMQDVFLFSDTIQENIRIGSKYDMDLKIIERAAKAARADEFIEDMEKQYKTVIGERGVGLSGGQKQRISIARAFAKKAPILILDDSTSALDMETESLIQRELNHLDRVGKIIIAHRISAVKNADEILILENGKIAERGNHEELMSRKGLYYDTYMAQYSYIV